MLRLRRRRKPPDHRMRSNLSKLNSTTLLVLDFVSQSSDAFPPLKSAAGGIKYILQLCDRVKANKKDCRELVQLSLEILHKIVHVIVTHPVNNLDLSDRIQNFEQIVNDIRDFMDILQRRNMVQLVINQKADESHLAMLHRRLDISMFSFTLVSSMKTEITVLEMKSDLAKHTERQEDQLRTLSDSTKILEKNMTMIVQAHRFLLVVLFIQPPTL